MWFGLDPLYWMMLIPALILGMWAQARVHSAFGKAQQVRAPMSGAAAARYVLDSAGLHDVGIERVQGHLSDHYDPRHKVLRLSPEVYQGQSMAAVGVAAHEAGHAIQDAERYAPLVVRNAAVPVANFGGGISIFLLIAGAMLEYSGLIMVGIAAYSAVVFLQFVDIAGEFAPSPRAKMQGD
jgi:uncharacterized protein